MENEKVKVNGNMQMSLFDVNAQIMKQLPDIDNESAFKQLYEFAKVIDSEYLMLLCKELSYYTIVKKDDKPEYANQADAILCCLGDWGTVKDITGNQGNIEIWVSNQEKDEMYCFHMFDCSSWVLKCGRI